MGCSKKFITSCAGKIKHKSFLGAEYSLQTNRHSSLADIYKCKECGFFHIGTYSKKKVKRKIKTKGKDEHKRKLKRFKY